MEEEKKNEEQKFNEKEFLDKVEKAAEKGVKKAGIKHTIYSIVAIVVVLVVLAAIVIPKVNSLNTGFDGIKEKLENAFMSDKVDNHDLGLVDDGLFGFTVADFEEAILGDEKKVDKIEVLKQEITDVATLTNAGAFGWHILTKSQVITYTGTVVYTVDMTKLKSGDITLDEKNFVVTIKIPHALQEDINILEDQIKFSDPEKGLLAFGDVKATPEDMAKVQAEARKKMQQKLDESNTLATADEFAKVVITNNYMPIIKGVSRAYTLEVDFK